MRKNEIEAVECFRHYLQAKGFYPGDPIDVKQDPPDTYLEVSGTKYAVEVSTLVDKSQNKNGKPLSRATFTAGLDRIASDITEKAKDQKILKGAYIIRFNPITYEFGKDKELIVKSALDFIERTQDETNCPADYILCQLEIEDGIDVVPYCPFEFPNPIPPDPDILAAANQAFCYIYKTGSPNDCVCANFAFLDWTEEIIADACSKLQDAIYEKNDKMQAISLPKILILHNKFRNMDTLNYKRCLNNLKSLDEFHTIFLIDGKRAGYVLHSLEGAWA